MNLTDEQFREAGSLCEAATPGPWDAGLENVYAVQRAGEPGPVRATVARLVGPDADRAFIAAARTLVPALLDEVERLRADLRTVYGRRQELQIMAEEARAEMAGAIALMTEAGVEPVPADCTAGHLIGQVELLRQQRDAARVECEALRRAREGETFCACGRRRSECDGSRAGCSQVDAAEAEVERLRAQEGNQ